MRALVEGVKAVVFCHFWPNEAMRAVVEGVKGVIFCHFWENEAMRAVGEGVKMSILSCHHGAGLGWAGWLAGLAGWLAKSTISCFFP